jgi:hypothetical protein
MDRNKLKTMLNDHHIPGILCSSNGEGDVNAAIFGSVRLLDKQSIVVALGDNRTLKNLHENSKATYIFFTPGQTLLAWQGARLYLETVSFEESGSLFDEIVAETRVSAGKRAAQMLKTAVVFKINDVRPLVDLAH